MILDVVDIEQKWVPRSIACIMVAKGLGQDVPISTFRLMQLVDAGKLEAKMVGEGKPRYYISLSSIEHFLVSK